MEHSPLGPAAVAFLDATAERCRVEGWPHVYAVGSFDREKTVAVQQFRAGALALALARRYRPETARIAIVGAGFSGVALASVLVRRGFRVDQFEKSGSPISVQARCRTTFVHPSLHNWPEAPFHDHAFSIGGISWRAGVVSRVAEDITRQYRHLARENAERFRTGFGQRVTSITRAEAPGGRQGYRLETEVGGAGEVHDAVVFAVGFGWEPVGAMKGALTRYWEGFRAAPASDAVPERVLVSGKGDRALIDILHASLRHYDPTRVFEVLPQLADPGIRAEVAEIEQRARDAPCAVDLLDEYRRVFQGRGWSGAIRRFGVNTGCQVVFNARPPGIFSLKSSALNRVLVYFLLKSGIVGLRPFPLRREAIRRANGNGSGAWRIAWAEDETPEDFDRLVLRHGIKADYFWRCFPQLRPGEGAARCHHRAGLDVPAEVLALLQCPAPGARLALGGAHP
ncbi:MAG: hypothetical protein EP320_10280 [Rhodobacteraceae bacterium]|nr:MAG: hypothetical protein EP320_10280 [Paracoccaceae bacterium]